MGDAAPRLPDWRLLEEAVRGNEDAFSEFCVQVLPRLFGAQKARCQRFGIPLDLADDFVQETLLRAVKWVNSHEARDLSVNFLSKISKNVVVDWLRQRREVSNAEARLARTPGGQHFGEDMLAVREAFENLADRDREILQLVLIEDYTPAEAARRLGIGSWSAYKRYERALRRLRDSLK